MSRIKDAILGGFAMLFFGLALILTGSVQDYKRSQELNGGWERPVKTLRKYYRE